MKSFNRQGIPAVPLPLMTHDVILRNHRRSRSQPARHSSTGRGPSLSTASPLDRPRVSYLAAADERDRAEERFRRAASCNL